MYPGFPGTVYSIPHIRILFPQTDAQTPSADAISSSLIMDALGTKIRENMEVNDDELNK